MRRPFVAAVLVVLGTFACSANAEHSVTFYFGAPQTVSGTPVSGFVPDHGYPPPDAGVHETVTLGLWAVPYFDWASEPDIWQGININIAATDGVTVDSIAINNSNHGGVFNPAYRWEASSDFGGTDGNFYLVGVQTYGLAGLLPAPYGSPADDLCYVDGPEGTGVLRYWLGNVTLTGHGSAGAVYLQVGDGGIARRGGVVAEDLIYFGLDGDAPLHGDQFGGMSATPEFYFGIPEPAGLLLLSLAALFLRRR